VLSHEEDSALLKAYIAEWGKFFTQCDYLPKPFGQLEIALTGKAHTAMQKKNQGEESIVRKVSPSQWFDRQL
jgi:cullin-5